MVETITPVVHGGSRRRWAGAALAHLAGAVASAAAFGAALAALGTALGAPWGAAGWVLLSATAALYAARELFGLPVPVPQRRRQVPEHWRTSLSPSTAAFLYGAGLGIGFLTFLRHGTLVAVALAAAASGSPLVGAVVVAPFGLARGLSLAVTANARTPADVRRVVEGLERRAVTRAPALANGGVLLAVAAAAAWATRAPGGGTLGSLPALALGAVFGWAGVAKVLRSSAWWRELASYRLGALEPLARRSVPALELGVPALALAGLLPAAGLLALALLVGYSLAVLRAGRLQGPRLPCGCFGRTVARDYRWLLARNGALAILALWTVRAPGGLGPLGSLGAPEPDEALAVALVVVGLAVLAWMLAGARALLRRAAD